MARRTWSKPLIMRRGATILDVAKEIHSKTAKDLRYAYISGKSAKFTNQRLGKEHVLQDGD